MTDKTISAYQGYGHRVQLIQREGVSRYWVVTDNRNVRFSSYSESIAKDMFLNHVASIVRQYAINFQS